MTYIRELSIHQQAHWGAYSAESQVSLTSRCHASWHMLGLINTQSIGGSSHTGHPVTEEMTRTHTIYLSDTDSEWLVRLKRSCRLSAETDLPKVYRLIKLTWRVLVQNPLLPGKNKVCWTMPFYPSMCEKTMRKALIRFCSYGADKMKGENTGYIISATFFLMY